MKRYFVITLMLLLCTVTLKAQLTGISPSVATHGQILQTTITGSGLFIQNMTPSGNLFSIKLKQGAYNIVVFDFFDWFNMMNTTVVDPNTVLTDQFTIPLAAPSGVYDLEVVTGDEWYPVWNQMLFTLPGAFTVFNPDGNITGNVYNDVNQNGIKDAGETGLSGRTLTISPANVTVTTNGIGDYTVPRQNGTYNVVLNSSSSDYMFLTTANDTLTATINNANSSGNDFGLKRTLLSITPDSGMKSTTALHQIVADEPIFATGANPWGNVGSLRIGSSPAINVSVSNITVINSYTIWASITIPAGTAVFSNVSVRVQTMSGIAPGYHYLYGVFDIVPAPNNVHGNVFFDQNLNKIKDMGEPGISWARIDMTPDNTLAYTDNLGNYALGTMGGVQTVTYANNLLPGLMLHTDSTSFTMQAVGNIFGKDFGLKSTLPDYTLKLYGPNLFARCNTIQSVPGYFRNTGNAAFDAKAWIKFDPQMTYVSSYPPGAVVSNDTVYWNFTNILPYTSKQFSANFMLPGAGSTIAYSAGVTSLNAGGVPQFTESAGDTVTVICAWDPNDKQVVPPGIFAQNYTLMSDTLTYLIRFQNTGSDTAFNVVIIDTLDADLDLNSFEILNTSHSMQTEIKSNGRVRFVFNNIMLPDSNVNEAASHGFIQYRIRVLPGLPDATPVNNTAHIFFDFNPAVVTNTTLNTMVYVLPVGLSEQQEQERVRIYPNPFSDHAELHFSNTLHQTHSLILTDITGKTVSEKMTTAQDKFVIDRKNLRAGLYFYNLTNEITGRKHVGKMVVR